MVSPFFDLTTRMKWHEWYEWYEWHDSKTYWISIGDGPAFTQVLQPWMLRIPARGESLDLFLVTQRCTQQFRPCSNMSRCRSLSVNYAGSDAIDASSPALSGSRLLRTAPRLAELVSTKVFDLAIIAANSKMSHLF
jgi:hypothetical protein